MKISYLVAALISGLLASPMAMASTMVMKPGETFRPSPVSKVHSIMSMGKIEAIDQHARKIRINGVDYNFDPSTTRFVSVSGAAQLKPGDLIHFWIKQDMTQHIPVIDKIELLANPVVRGTRP